ncbi:MAG: ribosomal protein L7/L12 [Anaerolineae bacterium]|nr:ribosomal protein L7/L12 [Anaerolineae bacterium]
MLREVPPDIIPKVERLSAQGQKIEAIKIVREATHWGLKESKDYVESLIVDGYATPPQRSALTGLTPAVMAKVQDLLSHHHHIEAIKLVREATGWGLKESKEYVETLKVK